MARLNVNPTRMVLTNLKKQMKVAVRGHKLMKDKRDELMKRFLELARENKRLREEVEAQLMEVYASFSIASARNDTGHDGGGAHVSQAGRVSDRGQ